MVLGERCENEIEDGGARAPTWAMKIVHESAARIRSSGRLVQAFRAGTAFVIAQRVPGPEWIAVTVFRLGDVIAAHRNQFWCIALLSSVAVLIVGGYAAYLDHKATAAAALETTGSQSPEQITRSVLDSLPIGITLVDVTTETPLLQNLLAAELLGDSDTTCSAQRLYRQVLEAQDPATSPDVDHGLVQFEWQRPDGQSTLLGIVISELHLAGSKVALLGFLDIGSTQSDEHAAAMQAKLDSAIHSASLPLAILGHEIRTPLHGVTGNLELLARAGLTQEQRERVAVIRRSFDDMLILVNNMLEAAKLETGAPTLNRAPMRINEIVEQCGQMFAPGIIERTIDFYCITDPLLDETVVGDAQRFRQVLQNLLGNAAKFTQSGRISIASRCLRLGNDTLWARFEITDTGIGIPTDAQSFLFQPLVQADDSITRRFGGTGLGLFLCRQFVELMGGEIHLASESGVGSTFTVDLPFQRGMTSDDDVGHPLLNLYIDVICDIPEWRNALWARLSKWGALEFDPHHMQFDPVLRLRAGPSSGDLCKGGLRPPTLGTLHLDASGPLVPVANANGEHFLTSLSTRSLWTACMNLVGSAGSEHLDLPKAGSLDILVAEDDAVSRMLIVRQLESLGCRLVRTASDGCDALQQWLTKKPDVLLTDLNLPGLDGSDLLTALRQRDASAIVIATTAAAPNDYDLRRSGFHGVLYKPVRLDDLRDVLLRVLPATHGAHRATESDAQTRESEPRTAALHRAFATVWVQDHRVLVESMDAGDLASLRRRLHRLQGALLAVGQDGLAQACLDLQHRANQSVDVSILREQCDTFFRRVNEYVLMR
ncbi:hypothetical protein WL40_10760 [Burkholderia ubonensis]|nr:hypothetical protein WL40_10760 [Burkholderia ubonensis]